MDSPSIFGLPMNIDRSVQRFSIQQIVRGVKQLTAFRAKNIAFDRKVWSKVLSPVLKLWKHLYKKIKEGNGIPKI